MAGLPEALLVSTIIPHPTVMLRRSSMKSIGGYNESLRGGGDFEYWWRAALGGAKFAYTTRIFLDRHRDAQNLTTDRVVFGLHFSQALLICELTAFENGRNELLPLIRDARYRSWHKVMLEQIRRGEHREAFTSYKESIKYVRWIYGLTVVLASYLFSVLFGPRSVEQLRKWIGPRCMDQVRKLRQSIK
jgi:hypothetical protein